MALLFELLLTAALTLLAAFLLATFFAANDPRREPDRAAAAIAEERIIEVDEVKLSERRAAVPTLEAEGWVEVEKAPADVVMKAPECSPESDEEGVPVKAARAVAPGAGLEEEVDVGEKRCDLTATGVVVEANPHVSVAETAPRGVPDMVGLERGLLQDAGAKQHDLGADAAPIEVHGAEKKQDVVVAEVLPTKLEAVEAEQQHLVSDVAPSAEVLDAGTEESVQAIEVRPDELAAETASEEIPDVVLERKDEQTVEEKEDELAAEAVPQAALNVPLAEKEELKAQQTVEEVVNTREEVQNKEETKCEAPPTDQHEELVPEEKFVTKKTGDVVVSHKGGSSTDKVATEFPVEVVALQEPPKDDAEADMDFGEWEGIERSEVEKRFGAAAAFAASEAGAAALSKLNSDVQLQLEGLLKVAIDGPCFDSMQPLTLRPSSRAKWYSFLFLIAWLPLSLACSGSLVGHVLMIETTGLDVINPGGLCFTVPNCQMMYILEP
jgi:hypothetical protein